MSAKRLYRKIRITLHGRQKRMMKAHYLGHVVFYVKDLQRSLVLYRDLLGFKEVGRIFNGAAAALTSGRTHHELLLIQVGDAPGPPPMTALMSCVWPSGSWNNSGLRSTA